MNRSVLVGVCGVVAGLAVGVASSSRVADAQAHAPVPRQEARCQWTTTGATIGSYLALSDLNAWLAARAREGFVLVPPAAGGAAVGAAAALVCVTRPAP